MASHRQEDIAAVASSLGIALVPLPRNVTMLVLLWLRVSAFAFAIPFAYASAFASAYVSSTLDPSVYRSTLGLFATEGVATSLPGE